MKDRPRYTVYEAVRKSSDLEDTLVAGLVRAVGLAFGEAPSDTPEHLRGDQLVTAQNDANEVLGFSVLNIGSPAKLLNNKVLPKETGGYFAAGVVAQPHQHHGIYRELNAFRLKEVRDRKLPLVFTRTQNPRVEEGMIRALAEEKKHGVRVVGMQRILVPGFYGQQLANTRFQARSEKIQRHYDDLDLARGDAYILMFLLEYLRKERA